MAVIGKIREKSTLVLIIIGGAIVAFVLSDLFNSGGGGQQGPINLAEINGETVSPVDFDAKVQQGYASYQSQNQQPLDERTKSSIREQAWNEIVSDVIVGNEMEMLGIDVTTKELFDMVQGNDPHPQVKQAFTNPENGVFDPNQVVGFIQNLDQNPTQKESWITFERAIKRNQRLSKYWGLIKKGVYMPNKLAEMSDSEANNKLNMNYVYKAYSSVNDTTLTVSQQELLAYYEENIADYEQKASRKIFYAFFPIGPSAKDEEEARLEAIDLKTALMEAEDDSVFVNINSDSPFDPTFYALEKAPLGADTSLWSKEIGTITEPYKIAGTYYIQKLRAVKMMPDSVMASHILINQTDRTPEQANQIADSLMNLLESGTKMEDIAEDNSDDVGSAQNGGDLGWFTEGTMVKPFSDAAFSSEVGDFVKVESQFGIHLIEVTDKTELKKKIQIASLTRKVEAGKETYENRFNAANSFSIEATDLESFNNLVNEGNLQRRVAVIGENDNVIQGFAASRDLVRWAKDADENSVSEAYDLDNGFAVAILETISEEGPAPMDKVLASVEYGAKRDAKANQFAEEMSGSADLNGLAAKLGLSVKQAPSVAFSDANLQGVGSEPAVIGKAYSLEAGQTSVPIKGNNGVFVVTLNAKNAAAPNTDLVKDNFYRGAQSRVDNGAVFNALKENAELVDNRSKFY